MKCPYCNREHSDDALFCEYTGKKLEPLKPQLKSCTNKDCPDYGKAILPAEAKFCPRCGSPIEGVEEDTGVSANSLDYAQMLDVLKQIIASNNTNNNISSKEDNFVIKNKSFTANGVTFKMIYVQGGTYIVEDNSEKSAFSFYHKKSAHKETVDDFMIGETQVTQELWQAVMGNNPSYFTGDLQRPVECVSWDNSQEFIEKLNKLTNQNFRLLTESEWEYAARGGCQSKGYKYSGANYADAVAWYGGNSDNATHRVKTKQPNELGIYDMSGNVYEWCLDEQNANARILRGASWYDNISYLCVSQRCTANQGNRVNRIGLRLAL